MVKTTVYVPEAVKKRLAKLARERGRSEAELIRDALQRLVDQAERPRPTVPLFQSGRPPIAERVDEELAKGFGRD